MKPKLATGKEPLKVSIDMVFATVKGIIEAGEEDAFLKACAKRDAHVIVDPEFVNFVKNYINRKGAHEKSAFAMRAHQSERCSA